MWGCRCWCFLAGRALDMVFRLPGLHMVNTVLRRRVRGAARRGDCRADLRGALVLAALLAAGEQCGAEETLSQSKLYVLLYVENPVAQLFRQA